MLKMLIRENRELCKYVFTFCKTFLYLSELSEKRLFFNFSLENYFHIKQGVCRLNIQVCKYIYVHVCMCFSLFRYQFLIALLSMAVETACHLSKHRNCNYIAPLYWEKSKTPEKNPNKLGWQPEFDLYGTFQAWQPKLTLLAISCTKMVSVLSGSVVRFIGCETHFRWYFLSKQSHLKPMTTIFNDVIV